MLTIAIIPGPGINLLPTNDECIESHNKRPARFHLAGLLFITIAY
jgi:hypothetical protein